MDNILFQLSQIISCYPDALKDRKKLNALLRDYMVGEKLIRNTLLLVFDESIVEELRSKHNIDNPELCIESCQMTG